MKKTQFLFLIGLPRSGTKLLRDMLNNHPQISIDQLETQFIPKLYEEFVDADLSKREVFHRLYLAFLCSVYAINVRNRGRDVLSEEDWYSSCVNFSLTEVFQRFFELTLMHDKPAATIIGDKTPRYTSHVPLLMTLFPDALFVHIVRDPRDRALSEQKVWSKSLRKSVANWNVVLTRLQQPLTESPDKFLEVRYEDLLAETDVTLRRIIVFLNLPWLDGLENLQTTSSERYGNARGAMKVVSANTGQYNKKLTLEQISRTEEIAYPMLRNYVYPINCAESEIPLSWIGGKLLSITDKLGLCLFHVRDKGLFAGLRYFRRISAR